MATEPLLDSGRLNYGSYLHLDELLNAQHPASSPAHHDELLFIVQHQTTALWLKLVIHELSSAAERFASDDPATALKRIARVKHIQRLADWSKDKVFVYGGREGKSTPLFNSGDCAMHIASSGSGAGFSVGGNSSASFVGGTLDRSLSSSRRAASGMGRAIQSGSFRDQSFSKRVWMDATYCGVCHDETTRNDS